MNLSIQREVDEFFEEYREEQENTLAEARGAMAQCFRVVKLLWQQERLLCSNLNHQPLELALCRMALAEARRHLAAKKLTYQETRLMQLDGVDPDEEED